MKEKAITSGRSVHRVECTPREGAQALGVVFGIGTTATLDIAKARGNAFTGAIESSHPCASEAEPEPEAHRPIMGRHAFGYCARLHRRAVQRGPQAYQWIALVPPASGATCLYAGMNRSDT